MIFNYVYNTYRGVVTYVRVVDGMLHPRERIQMMSTRATHELLEIGVSSPEPTPSKGLGVGEVGYLITSIEYAESKVGDTVTNLAKPASESLSGYADAKPMVFSGLYPLDGTDYPVLRDALGTESQRRCVGLPNRDVCSARLRFPCRVPWFASPSRSRERLEREYNLDLISTAPNVEYEVTLEDKKVIHVTNPRRNPAGKISEVREPMVSATILAPNEFVAESLDISKPPSTNAGHGLLVRGPRCSSLLNHRRDHIDFFDLLKSKTRGYASLDWKADGEQVADLVKVDILLQGERVDASVPSRTATRPMPMV